MDFIVHTIQAEKLAQQLLRNDVPVSAGLAVFRRQDNKRGFELLVGKPGGKSYKNRNQHVWTIPKGGFDNSKDSTLAHCAIREFNEETALITKGVVKTRTLIDLGYIIQYSGKHVFVYGVEQQLTDQQIDDNWQSNQHEIEGELCPELCKLRFIDPIKDIDLMIRAQGVLIDRIAAAIS